MQLIGIDIGSSSVKVSVLDGGSGRVLASTHSPSEEMKIGAPRAGWAEQDPETWYKNLRIALGRCLESDIVSVEKIKAIGLSYQMHGLVVVDAKLNVIRPSIIWCDSRAVETGEEAFKNLGSEYCLNNLLNSPGNFTASKLAWLKRNEPDNYSKIYKVMLPGDYIAMRLTGSSSTTVSGLSEGIFWDFKRGEISSELMDYYGLEKKHIPGLVDTFSNQGRLTSEAATSLGLTEDVIVSYRAGDQPNNALSLNVLEPGEIAATAGTSGVIYGVTDRAIPDKESRINMFAHVNHSPTSQRLGILACINGTGILNSWVRNLVGQDISYYEMNRLAGEIQPGAGGLTIYPFGNGSERLLGNRETGASFQNINLNIHTREHIFRAVQESIAFSFRYAFDIINELGTGIKVIRAGKANMFLSPLFCKIVSTLTGASINLYNTDGSVGAARGAGIGAGYFNDMNEAFRDLKVVDRYTPDNSLVTIYEDLYTRWRAGLEIVLTGITR